MIPTKERCLELQVEYNMLKQIQRHTKIVSDVASYIGEALNNNGHNINLPLMQSSGLLHDITKSHQNLVAALFGSNDKWFDDNVSELQGKFIDIYNQWEDMKNKFDIEEPYHHAHTGSILLKDLGYGEVADVIEKHDQPLVELSEAGLLCYSDRIVGKEVVPLYRRFKYVQHKYGQKWVDKLLPQTQQLENLILSEAKLTFKEIYHDV